MPPSKRRELKGELYNPEAAKDRMEKLLKEVDKGRYKPSTILDVKKKKKVVDSLVKKG